jgi:hypothetical protein
MCRWSAVMNSKFYVSLYYRVNVCVQEFQLDLVSKIGSRVILKVSDKKKISVNSGKIKIC